MYQKWLAAFHAVARAGGFTAAAKTLGVGQPTVSTHVKSLEEHFRVELFFRRGRHVELTPIGEALLTITYGLYGHEEEAVALLSAARDLGVGTLAIDAVRPADAIEILADFHSLHPRLNLEVTIASSPAILDKLLRFETDVGIVGHRPEDPRFHSLYYNQHRILVLVPARHALARRQRLSVKDLEGEDVILRARGSTTRTALDAAVESTGVTLHSVMESNSREVVASAVARGIGIGFISEPEYVPHKGIRTMRVEDAPLFTQAYVVCLAERKSRPLLKSFFTLAAARARRERPAARG